MKACFAVLCVLLAASAGVQGRRLLVDEGVSCRRLWPAGRGLKGRGRRVPKARSA